MRSANQSGRLSMYADRCTFPAGLLPAAGLFVIAWMVSFCLPGSNAEAETSVKGQFLPAWDVICGSGRDIENGCAAVRAREIVDASQYPWRAIGRVNFSGHRTQLHCTGALISERIVLTAAHCFFDDIRKQWLRPERIHFQAGYQRGAHAAHSVAARYFVSDIHDTSGMKHQYDPLNDWALIELREPIGMETGYLAWQQLDGDGLESELQAGGRVGMAGYPRLRSHVLSVNSECNEVEIRKSGSGDMITAQCAAIFGDSGGPVLLRKNGQLTVIAIVSGVLVEDGKLVNISVPATNFEGEILNVLNSDSSR